MDDSNQKAEQIIDQELASANSESSVGQSPSPGVGSTELSTLGSEVATLPLAAPTTSAARVSASAISVLSGQVSLAQQGGPLQLVYALGTIGYDLGTEARHDSIKQFMPADSDPNRPEQLLAYLASNPYEAARVIWTLNQDVTPIYAIRPAGSYANIVYDRLREFLDGQLTAGVEQVSIPGVVAGSATLLSGRIVPQIVPELRGMFSWNAPALVEAALGERLPETADEAQRVEYERRARGITNFLQHVYYELRGLGLSPQERAINFSATNAFQVARVFQEATGALLDLDSIAAERSPICRPESDCWDVKLTFFDPTNRLTRARVVYRFTVDVSDVEPVSVGPVRSWSVY